MRLGLLNLGAEAVPLAGLQCLFACQPWQLPSRFLTVLTCWCCLQACPLVSSRGTINSKLTLNDFALPTFDQTVKPLCRPSCICLFVLNNVFTWCERGTMSPFDVSIITVRMT